MQLPWAYDVVTEHAALTTTGGRVWDAARRLCSFLEEVGPELGLSRPGLRVLELGSGLGWLGMTLARNLVDAEAVVLTEQEEGGGLDWLRHNLALNAHLPGMAVVRAEPCDWRRYYHPHDHYRDDLVEQQQQGEGEGEGPPCSYACGRGRVRRSGSGSSGGERPAKGEAGDPRGSGGGGGGGGGGAEPAPAPAPRSGRNGDPAGGGLGGGGVSADTAAAAATTTTSAATIPTSTGEPPRGGCGGDPWVGGVECPLSRPTWDLVLGSDLVYNEVGADCLPRVMRALAGPSTRILYCHTKHRFDTHDMQFFSQLAACGLKSVEVREPGVPTPPPSPPPLTELFPEMRIAVYDIRPSGTQ